jgi:uncharacterized protein
MLGRDRDLHPFPTERVAVPVMHQAWTDLTFLHWSLPPQRVRPLVPAALDIDTIDARAWISVTPFLMQGLRPPGVPALPWISRMGETNVRTYVRGPDGRRGIFFLSLDIARLAAAIVGRAAYRLPYMWADATVDVEGNTITYRGERRWGGAPAAWDIVIERGRPLPAEAVTALDHFLSARWVLYAMYGPIVAATPAEHEPWPLWTARATHLREGLLAAAGVASRPDEPLVRYSPGVHARIGVTRPVGRHRGSDAARGRRLALGPRGA